MKNIYIKLLLILIVLSGCLHNALAQAPEGIIYQAEARDERGKIIANSDLDVMITILKDNANGNIVWKGFHNVRTNDYGMFVLIIGEGSPQTGDFFEDIEWENYYHFLNVGVKKSKKTDYVDMGTTQLLSVPYALHAKTAERAIIDEVDDADADPENELQNISINDHDLTISDGNTITIPDEIDDADADPTNEIITGAILEGNDLKITDAGGINTVDLSSFSSTWAQNGADINFNGGNVGIGESIPLGLLHLKESVSGSGTTFILNKKDWDDQGSGDHDFIDIKGSWTSEGYSTPSSMIRFYQDESFPALRMEDINGNYNLRMTPYGLWINNPEGKVHLDWENGISLSNYSLQIATTINANEGAVFNEQGGDLNFRVEGIGEPNAFFVDGSNGKVGIGTTSPDENLHIAGNLKLEGTFGDKNGNAGSAGQILSSTGIGTEWITSPGGGDFSNGGEASGADRTLGNTDSYALSFKTANTSRLKIQNDGGMRIDGNVGIFTDPDLESNINKSIKLYASGTYSNPNVNISGHNSANIYLESRRAGNSSETSGKKWTISSGSGSVLDLDKFTINNTDDGNCFTIRDGGNIGIGTLTPSAKLEVAGQVKITGGSPGMGKVLTSSNDGLASWELPTDNVNDADANPNNEIQDLQLVGNTLTITLNGTPTEIDLSTYLDDTDTQLTEFEVDAMVDNNGFQLAVDDGDIDNLNELQSISVDNHELTISDGNTVTLPDDIDDADADPANELITGAILDGNDLKITDAGGMNTVDLSSFSSLWAKNGADINFNGGNVGIGTTSPTSTFQVNGWTTFFGGVSVRGTNGDPTLPSAELKINRSTLSSSAVIQFSSDPVSRWHIGLKQGDNSFHFFDTYYGNEPLIIKEGTGHVGIGTGNPEEKLHIAGNMKLEGTFGDKNGNIGSSGQILSSTGTGTEWITGLNSDEIGWTKSGNDMYSDVSGNIGIGTMSPVSKLEIVADSDNPPFRLTRQEDSNLNAEFEVDSHGNLALHPSGGVLFLVDDDIHMWGEGSNTMTNVFSVQGDSYFNGGSLGIGTTNPLTRLQVDGNITLAPAGISSNESRFIGQSIASQSSFVANMGFGGMEVENIDVAGDDDSEQQIHFWTHDQGVESARRMTIDIYGNVGIGTTSPTHKLDVSGDINFTGDLYQNDVKINNSPWSFNGSDVFFDSGNVGIGTNNPLAGLHVNGDDGVFFNGTFGSGSIPNGISGSTMIWYPKKAAFRVGYDDVGNWDDANIGDYSIAMGSWTQASGIASTAMGGKTNASGDHSVAIGFETSASGTASVAMGGNTNASGDQSTAMGEHTRAIGIQSTATGWNTEASGAQSFASGFNTEASGECSVAMGNGSIASGERSTAMGESTIANQLVSTAMGRSTTASGHASTSMGEESTASGHVSIAMGASTIASGHTSTAMGLLTSASGQSSTAMGDKTQAIGDASTSMGGNTTASGAFSTAMGTHTTASGHAATAMGIETTASGSHSTAIGHYTKAESFSSTAIGQYNVGGGDNQAWTGVDPLFEIGNGDSEENRLNAMTVLQSGNVGIGTATPDEKLHVSGNLRLDGTFGDKNGNAGSAGQILSSTGIGTEWITSLGSGDFSNGGEAGNEDRTLGNTDDYALGFKTNNTSRLHIANNGNVGIGTTSATASLHVSGNDGFLSTGTFNNGLAQNLGAGTRMHFYNRKGAFRVGSVTDDKWDDANIGSYSIAMGYNTKASQTYSISIGNNSGATSYGAIAIGSDNWAAGQNSVAIGNGNIAGQASSIALGSNTVANARNSFVAGLNTYTTSYASFVIGRYNSGGGNPSTWLDIDPLFEIGNGSDGSNRNNAFTVLKNGNIGIDTATPDEKLHIAGNMRLNGTFEDKDGEAGSAGQILSSTGIGTEWITSLGSGDFSNGGEAGNEDRTLGNTDDYALGFKTNNTSRLHIANNGNVGIGTTSPGEALSVIGEIECHSIDFKGGAYKITRDGPGYIQIGDGINDEIYLNADVGIGTTSPKSKLQVNGGVQIADDDGAATADKVGTLKYRADSNNSYVEMCMQTGESSYAWVIVKQNTW